MEQRGILLVAAWLLALLAFPTSVAAQDPGAALVNRLKEIRDDPESDPATVDGVKKLLDELARENPRFRWDGPEGPPIGRTTPDEPGRPPAIPDKFEPKWGKKQLIVISRNWRQQLCDWVPGLNNPNMSDSTKLDVLIGILLHELKHAEDGPYDWPPPTPKHKAEIEIPALCRQIQLYWDLVGQEPYFSGPTYTPQGRTLRDWIRAKTAQKEEWLRIKNA